LRSSDGQEALEGLGGKYKAYPCSSGLENAGMNGMEFLNKLRPIPEQWDSVMMVTTEDEKSSIVKANSIGSCNYILKIAHLLKRYEKDR
jgi:DNA-binding response OmpR family regulator